MHPEDHMEVEGHSFVAFVGCIGQSHGVLIHPLCFTWHAFEGKDLSSRIYTHHVKVMDFIFHDDCLLNRNICNMSIRCAHIHLASIVGHVFGINGELEPMWNECYPLGREK